MSEKKINIVLGRAVYAPVPPICAQNYAAFCAYSMRLAITNGWDLNLIQATGICYPDRARSMLVRQALAKNADFIFMSDPDMMLPMDLLLTLLKAEKPIVAAMAFMRHYPYEPAVYEQTRDEQGNITSSGRLYDWDKGERYRRVGVIGGACKLVHTEVYKAMRDKFEDEWWYRQAGEIGEDDWFCRRAAAMGIPIFVDTETIAGHVGEAVFDEKDYARAISEIGMPDKCPHGFWQPNEYRENKRIQGGWCKECNGDREEQVPNFSESSGER